MLRRLPIPLPPVAGETAASYLRRLAKANHLAADDLEDTIAYGKRKSYPSPRKRRLDLERLACLTGFPATRLDHAVPDLSGLKARFVQRSPRSACPHCVRRHRGGPVHIYLREHRHVCLRHGVWFGSLGPAKPGYPMPPGPVDIRVLPIVLRAQRRHQRLIHHYGEAATFAAVRTAVDTWERMHQPRYLAERDWHRLRIVRPGTDSANINDPLVHAIRYPEIVTITSVLASPHWQAMAASWTTEQKVFNELDRRLELGGHREWQPPKRHPLTYWIEHQQRRRQGADHSARATYTETGSWTGSQ